MANGMRVFCCDLAALAACLWLVTPSIIVTLSMFSLYALFSLVLLFFFSYLIFSFFNLWNPKFLFSEVKKHNQLVFSHLKSRKTSNQKENPERRAHCFRISLSLPLSIPSYIPPHQIPFSSSTFSFFSFTLHQLLFTPLLTEKRRKLTHLLTFILSYLTVSSFFSFLLSHLHSFLHSFLLSSNHLYLFSFTHTIQIIFQPINLS